VEVLTTLPLALARAIRQALAATTVQGLPNQHLVGINPFSAPIAHAIELARSRPYRPATRFTLNHEFTLV
jgi:hypothetical protein